MLKNKEEEDEKEGVKKEERVERERESQGKRKEIKKRKKVRRVLGWFYEARGKDLELCRCLSESIEKGAPLLCFMRNGVQREGFKGKRSFKSDNGQESKTKVQSRTGGLKRMVCWA